MALDQLQSELVGVQSSLFSLGLELEASQRSLRQSQLQGDDLMRFKDRLNADLQEVLQHREVTEKHNQVSECSEYVRKPNCQKINACCIMHNLSCRTSAVPFRKLALSFKPKKQL